jgi:hypothetical protein
MLGCVVANVEALQLRGVTDLYHQLRAKAQVKAGGVQQSAVERHHET